MPIDWTAPMASNAILGDVQQIQAMLNACIRLAPTGDNIPAGALKLADVSGGRQIQAYNGSTSFGSVGKLMHDVDAVDGYHAQISVPGSGAATKNVVVVRNGDGKVEGDITGYAAGITGTLPADQGGTGRSDGSAQDVIVPVAGSQSTAQALGQIGNAIDLGTTDLDTLIESGFYVGASSVSHAAAMHYPYTASAAAALRVSRTESGLISQQLMYGTQGALWTRWSSNGGSSWSAWVPWGGQHGSDVAIHISKSGSDANTGLDQSYPVATVARAMQIAQGLQPSTAAGVICLRFGAGNWNDVTISAKGCALRIQAYDGQPAASWSSDLPVFGTLTLQGVYATIQSVTATVIDVTDGGYACIDAGLSRIGRLTAEKGGVISIAGSSNPVEIMNGGQRSVFDPCRGGTIYIAGARTLALTSNVTVSDGFLSVADGGKYISQYALTFSLGSYAVTGAKAYVGAGCEVISAVQPLSSFPGSANTNIAIGAILTGIPRGDGSTTKYLRADGTWNVPYTHPTFAAVTGVPAANAAPGFGGSFTVNQVSRDTNGHVSAITSRTITIPATAASTTANGLVTTGTQTFAGKKTFNDEVVFKDADTVFSAGFTSNMDIFAKQGVQIQGTGIALYLTRGYALADAKNGGFYVDNGKTCSLLCGTSYVGLYDNNNSQWVVRVGSSKSYVHYGTVSAVSDERQKKNIEDVHEKLLDAWENVSWQQFLYKDVMNSKLNVGLVAQRVEQTLQEYGITAEDYSFLEHDRWEKNDEHKEAGDQYYVHYNEALSIEAAYMRRKTARLEERIAKLEKQFA